MTGGVDKTNSGQARPIVPMGRDANPSVPAVDGAGRGFAERLAELGASRKSTTSAGEASASQRLTQVIRDGKACGRMPEEVMKEAVALELQKAFGDRLNPEQISRIQEAVATNPALVDLYSRLSSQL